MLSVVLSIVGSQRDASGDTEEFELVTAGKYYRHADVDYFAYDESELTGMEGVRTLLKVYHDKVVLVRMGAVKQRQEFCIGMHNISNYETPYGVLSLGVRTKDLTIELCDGVGSMAIAYDLDIGGKWQSFNRLGICVREEKKDGY